MIGYRVSLTDLRTEIEKESKGWLADTAKRTAEFQKLGKYQEKSSIWSKVKPVYMKHQGDSKCAYCERKLESVKLGRPEQDVEHYRPKGNVAPWKASESLLEDGYLATSPPANAAYFLLAYHPFNYVAACGPCNQLLKGDRFPIAGPYDFSTNDPESLQKTEKPYVIYPFGDFDADPEDLIGFNGISPFARKASGHDRLRALVTIEFFALDNVLWRSNLVRERAMIITALFPQLELEAAADPIRKKTARKLIQANTSPKAPHTNCARSFARLFAENRERAQEIFEAAATFIESKS